VSKNTTSADNPNWQINLIVLQMKLILRTGIDYIKTQAKQEQFQLKAFKVTCSRPYESEYMDQKKLNNWTAKQTF
jgi:hypothetical protein